MPDSLLALAITADGKKVCGPYGGVPFFRGRVAIAPQRGDGSCDGACGKTFAASGSARPASA